VSIELLETAAGALGPLRERVVFLGGATIGLWMTDPASRAPRVTYDVDVVAEVLTRARYEAFQAELRQAGFQEDVESAVICRWQHPETGLILDAIPAEPSLAGFGGHWLRPAVEAAIEHRLPSGTVIRVVPPAYLLATKLEAFADRGGDDCIASRDFEDLVLLVDSREEIRDELGSAADELQAYVRAELDRIMRLATFEYGVEGALTGPGARARADSVTIPLLRQLAA
jgi:hypothetical protein